jgi:hypothetical protein
MATPTLFAALKEAFEARVRLTYPDCKVIDTHREDLFFVLFSSSRLLCIANNGSNVGVYLNGKSKTFDSSTELANQVDAFFTDAHETVVQRMERCLVEALDKEKADYKVVYGKQSLSIKVTKDDDDIRTIKIVEDEDGVNVTASCDSYSASVKDSSIEEIVAQLVYYSVCRWTFSEPPHKAQKTE